MHHGGAVSPLACYVPREPCCAREFRSKILFTDRIRNGAGSSEAAIRKSGRLCWRDSSSGTIGDADGKKAADAVEDASQNEIIA